jgi:signal recognition particle GTPase
MTEDSRKTGEEIVSNRTLEEVERGLFIQSIDLDVAQKIVERLRQSERERDELASQAVSGIQALRYVAAKVADEDCVGVMFKNPEGYTSFQFRQVQQKDSTGKVSYAYLVFGVGAREVKT